MILAELNGKLPSSLDNKEDILTSNVFSFFKYANRRYLKDYLLSLGIEVTIGEAIEAEFLFWPKYNDGTEPDLVILCGRYYFLVEAKLFSDFSSETDKADSQLDREERMGLLEANNINKEFVFIAITAEYCFNKKKYRRFEKVGYHFKWTNWQKVASFLDVRLGVGSLRNDLYFISDLYELLVKKNLRTFIGLTDLAPKQKIVKPSLIFYDQTTSNFKGEYTGFMNVLVGFSTIKPYSKSFNKTFFNFSPKQIIQITQNIFFNDISSF